MSQFVKDQQFPDVAVDTFYGGKQHISAMLNAKGKTVFWFLRYIGCTVCRYDVHLFMQHYTQIQEKSTKIYIVMQSTKEILNKELGGIKLPFDLICDPTMKLYHTLNILPAVSMEALLGNNPEKLQAKSAAAAKAGFSHGQYEGDEKQLPAFFIVDAQQKILLAHYAKDIMDMPTIDELLAML